MDFYAFFVTSKCGVMGMGLDVTAGGDKGFFIDKRVYTTFLIPFFFFSVLDVLKTEWSLRERKSLMSTIFNIKNARDHHSSLQCWILNGL